MSETVFSKDGTAFTYDDLNGDVNFWHSQANGKLKGTVSFPALLEFVAYVVRLDRIKQINLATDNEILGIKCPPT